MAIHGNVHLVMSGTSKYFNEQLKPLAVHTYGSKSRQVLTGAVKNYCSPCNGCNTCMLLYWHYRHHKLIWNVAVKLTTLFHLLLPARHSVHRISSSPWHFAPKGHKGRAKNTSTKKHKDSRAPVLPETSANFFGNGAAAPILYILAVVK